MQTSELVLEFAKVEQLGDQIIGRINAARDHGAIWWSEAEKSWIVSGHAEVAERFRLSVPLSSERAALTDAAVTDNEAVRRSGDRLPLTAHSGPRRWDKFSDDEPAVNCNLC